MEITTPQTHQASAGSPNQRAANQTAAARPATADPATILWMNCPRMPTRGCSDQCSSWQPPDFSHLSFHTDRRKPRQRPPHPNKRMAQTTDKDADFKTAAQAYVSLRRAACEAPAFIPRETDRD